MANKKRERKKKERQRTRGSFLNYVESDKSLEVPPANASDAAMIAYIKRAESLMKGHEDEPGSGLLAWRMGKVLNWMKERCDNGQLDMGDGKKSTFIPEEFRTFDGEPPIIKVNSIEEMEQLAREKMDKHGLVGFGTQDDDEVTCPRFLLIHRCKVTSMDDLKGVAVIAEIRVDPTGKWD